MQPKNVFSLIIVTPSGITTDSSLLHSENACVPIAFTLLGIVTEARFSAKPNALSSIVVTPSGIVTETRFLFPINNPLPITVTGLPLISFGMSYDVTVSLSVALVIFTPPFPSLSYVRIASEAAGSWFEIALLPLITFLTL